MSFITFEGMEGAGKTTQIKLLQKALLKQGFDVVVTREPGGTPLGKTIRQLLLKNTMDIQHPLTDLCLFTADRLEHIETVIKPALSSGKVVICDRFTDSTLAYQVGGQALSEHAVNHFIALSELKPTLTIFLDLDPEEGLERVKRRSVVDRYEQKELAFHLRVRKKYHEIAQQEPERLFCINTQESSLKTTQKIILAKVKELLSQTCVI